MNKITRIILILIMIGQSSIRTWESNLVVLSKAIDQQSGQAKEKILLAQDKNTKKWDIFTYQSNVPSNKGYELKNAASNVFIKFIEETRNTVGIKDSAGNDIPDEERFGSKNASEDPDKFFVSDKNNERFFFIYEVPFIPGSDIYKAQKLPNTTTDDYFWADLDKFLSDKPLTKTNFRTKKEEDLQLEPNMREEIKEYIKYVKKGPWDKANFPDAIYFYDRGNAYYEFTNFFDAPITINGKEWPNSERYYQAQKFNNYPQLQEQIRLAGSTRDAFDIAQKNRSQVRNDWQKISLQEMLKAVRAKFNQNEELKNKLLSTGNRILVEDAGKNDAFYGAGEFYEGQNQLGQILIHVRDEIKTGQEKPYTSRNAEYFQGLTAPKAAQIIVPQKPVTTQQPTTQPPSQQLKIAPKASTNLHETFAQLSIELAALEKQLVKN